MVAEPLLGEDSVDAIVEIRQGRDGMRARHVLAAAFILAVMSCSSGPTLEQAVAELQKDARTLESDRLLSKPASQLRILERPDKDISCGEGRFKRVLVATADAGPSSGSVDSRLDRAQRVMETTLAQPDLGFGYDVQSDPQQVDSSTGRVIRATKEEIGLTMIVEVHPESPTWRLRAETSCLPR
ncbi:hypothetical protein C1J01_26565 [Nonomuraea aridisoli]|uniref:Uncharacterized protein n=1 Tax=Nonomuraea aridisoli TaxID=2070368 RepID=A0A2W2DRH6_9ACTN|nr:hypothetical protein C1J01_26565 [Nonomuraea aridisoli]